MKLLTFGSNENSRIGVVVGGGYVADLQKCFGKYLREVERIERGAKIASALIPEDMQEFIRGGSRSMEAARLGLMFATEKSAECEKAGLLAPESAITFYPPLQRPGKIICAGRNFREKTSQPGPRPDFPISFLKVSSSLVGHQGPIVVKQGMLADYEVEVAVVIGERAANIPPERALDVVFGYTVINDVSERATQQKERVAGIVMAGKNFDTFAPMGPYLVTRDELPDPMDLDLGLKVNGITRQDSNTKYMIFDVPALVSFWSRMMTLEPGDIIATGTPEGIAMLQPDPSAFYLKPGDTVEAEVKGIGILVNHVTAE